MSLHGLLAANRFVGQVVRMREGVLEDETVFEPDMLGIVLEVKVMDHDLFRFEIDVRPFDDHNTPLMTANYYDADGVPRLTAREAGFWHDVESYYQGEPLLWEARLERLGALSTDRKRRQDDRGRSIASLFPTQAAMHAHSRTMPEEAWIRTARSIAGLSSGEAPKVPCARSAPVPIIT